MPYYNLTVGEKLLSASARDRTEALLIFGQEIEKTLTLADQGGVAAHPLDEWNEGPHWVNPATPVWLADG